MVYLTSVYFSWFNYQTTPIDGNAFDTGVPRSNCYLFAKVYFIKLRGDNRNLNMKGFAVL